MRARHSNLYLDLDLLTDHGTNDINEFQGSEAPSEVGALVWRDSMAVLVTVASHLSTKAPTDMGVDLVEDLIRQRDTLIKGSGIPPSFNTLTDLQSKPSLDRVV